MTALTKEYQYEKQYSNSTFHSFILFKADFNAVIYNYS